MKRMTFRMCRLGPVAVVWLTVLVAGGSVLLTSSGDSRGGLEAHPVAAQPAASPQAVPSCSAWQLTWQVLPVDGRAPEELTLRDARLVVRSRLGDLEFYQSDHVLGGSRLITPTAASTGNPVFVVELLFRRESDTNMRLDAYERLLIRPGVLAIIDPLERDLAPGTPVLTMLESSAGGSATPAAAGPIHPVLFDGDDVWSAYPAVDDLGGYEVTLRLTEEAVPALEAYLGGRPSREVVILLDQEVIAVLEVDASSVEEQQIAFPASGDDQADAWTIVVRSDELPVPLEPVMREPVFSDACG